MVGHGPGYADRFAVVQGDAAQAATARAAVHAATAGFGRLDILVNLAGRFLGQSILDTSDEAWDALMATTKGRERATSPVPSSALTAGTPLSSRQAWQYLADRPDSGSGGPAGR